MILEEVEMPDEIRHIVANEGIDSSKTGYKKLISFYFGCKAYRDCKISLEFRHINWISGNMCALLQGVLHKLNKENSLLFTLDRDNYSHIKTNLPFLFSNGFLEDVVKMPYSRSAVVLSTFEKNSDQQFVEYIEKGLFGNTGMTIKTEKKTGMIDNFLEVFSNVQLHARTEEPIFACGQFFPQKQQLHFTLVDLGVGYLLPISEFTKGKVITSEDAIQWAIEGNTTKMDAPGGTGLKRIIKYCEETKGTLNIITGDTYWASDATITFNVPVFCGSMINLMFNCKNG